MPNTLKKLHKALLTFDTGSTIEVERIGHGRYSTAWANGHFVYLQTSDKDSSKEMLSRMPANPHIPQITELGSIGSNGDRLYQMPKYQKLTAKHSESWHQFKILKGFLDDAHKQVIRDSSPRYNWRAEQRNQLFEDLVRGAPALPATIGDAVGSLVFHCKNYGEYCIEISKTNCAVNAAGTLILLDPCFDLDELHKDQERRMKRARGY